MYMFFAYPNDVIPCGNDGMMKVPSSVRSWKKLTQLAESWLGNRVGRVWLIETFTQEMSEMSPRQFENYVARNGRMVAYR